MARWRYLLFDLPSMSPVAELPVLDRSFGDLYNSPGAFEATIRLDLDPALGVSLDNLQAPDAVFAAELDGHLLWAGPVLTLEPDFRAETVKLAGEGWLYLLGKRFQEFDHQFVGVDQTDIAAALIDNVQDITYHNGYIGIDTSLAYQGPTVARDRFYYFVEGKRTRELIEELAAVDNGFYFRFEPRWTAGPNSNLTIKFLTTFPASGRVTDLVLDDGRTCTVTAAPLDGTNLAYRVRVWGQGEGDAKLNKLVANQDQINAHYIIEDDEQHSTVTEEATLKAHGFTRLRKGQENTRVVTAQVSASMFGEFIVGDKVTVRMRRGLWTFTGSYRIVGYESPDEDVILLDLSPAALFEGGNLA